MRASRGIWCGVLVVTALALTACGSSGGSGGSPSASTGPSSVVAPVVMNVNDLQGAKVDLVVGQTLDINTQSLPVDSYTGTVSDEKVATFTQGRKDGSATFNPGVLAKAPGTATVTMRNAQGGIQPLEFTVVVTAGK